VAEQHPRVAHQQRTHDVVRRTRHGRLPGRRSVERGGYATLRSVGRIVSVVVGAFLAAGMAAAEPAAGWYAVAIAVAVVGAAATRESRWYVTPAFTTFIAISLLLYGHPHDVAYRFDQRVVETLVGVGIAYCFGLLVPRVQARLRRPSRQES